MDNPLVSIIIPTFNRAHLLGETLDSVLAQTYENWECIIVDDGSNDDTDEVVGAYVNKDGRFQFYHRPKNKLKGANSCRNYGAEVASGTYFIFLDSDDFLSDFCLEKRLETVANLRDFAFAVFPMFVKNSKGEISEKEIPIYKSYLDEFLSNKLHWGIMCSIWNRRSFIELKGFNENYLRLNDPDLHIRAMLYHPENYFVFTNSKCDSVYNISEDYCSTVFSEKVFQSLELFIPDIISHLKISENMFKKNLLKGYLIMWLKRFMATSTYNRNKEVIDLFYENQILSTFKKKVLKFNLFVYFSIVKISDLYRKRIVQKLL